MKKNSTVDIVRAIAITMVVIGHVISNCTYDAKESLTYNIIWSLQMPLFMLISGYITKFGARIYSAQALSRQICKRSISLIVPFIIWTFLIRGVVLGQTYFLNIKYLVFNMDVGYWFLFSLWTISIMFYTSLYFSNKIGIKFENPPSKSLDVILTLAICIVFWVALLLVGLWVGLSFLAIKYTLYYTLFYMVGYVFSAIEQPIKKLSSKFVLIATIVSGIIYSVLILSTNTVLMSDNALSLIYRVLISLFGSAFLCGVVSFTNRGRAVSKVLSYVGSHTLEIYVSHYIFLTLFKSDDLYSIFNIQGILVCLYKSVLALIGPLLLSFIINKNKYCSLIVFGKNKLKGEK